MSGPGPATRSRNLAGLPVVHAQAIAKQAASRGMSSNKLILEWISQRVEGMSAQTEEHPLLSLDLVHLIQRLAGPQALRPGGLDAVTMVSAAKQLLVWVRAFEKTGNFPPEGLTWIAAHEADQERDREKKFAAIQAEEQRG